MPFTWFKQYGNLRVALLNEAVDLRQKWNTTLIKILRKQLLVNALRVTRSVLAHNLVAGSLHYVDNVDTLADVALQFRQHGVTWIWSD